MERRTRRPTTEAGSLGAIPSFRKAIRLEGKSEGAALKDVLGVGAQESIHAESFVRFRGGTCFACVPMGLFE